MERGIPNFSDKDKVRVGEELSDVLSYVILLADACKIGIQFLCKTFQNV